MLQFVLLDPFDSIGESLLNWMIFLIREEWQLSLLYSVIGMASLS